MIKYYKLIIKTFDQLKNDNFDQLIFGQVIIPQYSINILKFMYIKNRIYSYL